MILRMNTIQMQNYIALFVVSLLAAVVFIVANYVQSGQLQRQADADVIAKKT